MSNSPRAKARRRERSHSRKEERRQRSDSKAGVRMSQFIKAREASRIPPALAAMLPEADKGTEL